MRYVRFGEDGQSIIDRQVADLDNLAEIMANATWDDWLERLGQATCQHDKVILQAVGKFIKQAKETL